jgi:biotin carboxyl carrier protein
MASKRKKAPNTEIVASKSSTSGLSASDAPVGETVGNRLEGLDVRAQSALLQEAFDTPDPLELDTPAPSPQRRDFVARWGWRALKSALGLGVLIIAGVGPVQRLLEFSSVEAVVNARLVSLRAPIDGKIEVADVAPTIGAVAPKGSFILRISNSRADRARLDDLRRLVDQTEGERSPIAKRLVRLKELYEQVFQQVREYVGDSYNDRPSSLQHADELSVRIAEAEAELSSRDQRLAKLRVDLDAEAVRYSELSNAVLSSPIEAMVWEVLVSPGEEVRKGQDLLRLLDCSGALVTVTVRESVFNQLRIGDEAQFRFSGQSGKYSGTIVRMSGSAAPPDNLAIQPTGLSSGGYRIAVSVPDLASTPCGVGRTGKVVFNASAGSRGTLQPIREAISFFLPGS